MSDPSPRGVQMMSGNMCDCHNWSVCGIEGGGGEAASFFKNTFPKSSTMNRHDLVNVQTWVGEGCARVERSFCFQFLFLERR